MIRIKRLFKFLHSIIVIDKVAGTIGGRGIIKGGFKLVGNIEEDDDEKLLFSICVSLRVEEGEEGEAGEESIKNNEIVTFFIIIISRIKEFDDQRIEIP